MDDPHQATCFTDQMGVVYDAVADDYGNAAGVVTRVPFFASTRGLIGSVSPPQCTRSFQLQLHRIIW
jgi:hypothetical protein